MRSEYIVRPRNAMTPAHDQPREKLARAGRDTLADAELIAVVLGHGVRGRSAVAIGERLLDAVGGLHGLARASADRLAVEFGVGSARAARLSAAVELGRRTLERWPAPKTRIGSPRELAAFLMPRYGAHGAERFGVVHLDARHQILRVRILATGSTDAVIAEPREVFRDALLAGASGVIVFHNHPSGDPSPSPEDIALTHRLSAAGKVVGVAFLDHVIIGDARYFSMRESGSLA